MKSFLIIGMGRFGSHLCRNLAKLGNEVMIVDQNEELLEPLLPYVTDAKIGDCTKENTTKDDPEKHRNPSKYSCLNSTCNRASSGNG